METIEIPSKIILDAMLGKLGLPRAVYSVWTHSNGTMNVSLEFYPTVELFKTSSGKIYKSTHALQDLDATENHLANEAIRHMELCHNKTRKDYSYAKLQTTQEANIALIKQVEEKTTTIKQLSRGWDSSLNTASSANDEVLQIVNDTMSPGDTPADYELNHTLLQIQEISEHLDQSILQSTVMLQEVGMYPYDVEPSYNEDEDEDLADLSPYNYTPAWDPNWRSTLEDEMISRRSQQFTSISVIYLCVFIMSDFV